MWSSDCFHTTVQPKQLSCGGEPACSQVGLYVSGMINQVHTLCSCMSKFCPILLILKLLAHALCWLSLKDRWPAKQKPLERKAHELANKLPCRSWVCGNAWSKKIYVHGPQVAIKIINKRKMEQMNMHEKIRREIQILQPQP